MTRSISGTPIADPDSRRHFATHEEAERLDMHGVYGTVVVIPKQARWVEANMERNTSAGSDMVVIIRLSTVLFK